MIEQLIKDIHETNQEFIRIQGSTEEDLARRDPDGYSLNVDGIRIIHVKELEGEHVIYNVVPRVGLIMKYDRNLI